MGKASPSTTPIESGVPRPLLGAQERLSRCQDRGELLEVLGGELANLLAVSDRISLVFVEPEEEWLRVYRVLPAAGPPPSPLPRVRVDGTPVGQVVREGRGRVVSDTRADPNITFGHASHDGIRSTISAPILVAGRVVGAINAGSRVPGRCTDEMLAELEEIAAVLGPTIYAAEQLWATADAAAPAGAEGCPQETPAGLVGRSVAFRGMMTAARRAAASDADVLITGETGAGKSALARAIHAWSPRSRGPFVTVQISDLSSTIVESELFGHERGAFTGALAARVGRFESAHGGTLFLDEVGEIPLALQAKLLRVIQDRCFERVGGSRTLRTDVRIIAATGRDLREAVARAEFRKDLYYRLNVVPLHVPPLRDRKEDLALLVEAILERFRGMDGHARLVSTDAWRRLVAHAWPGNVRELEAVLRRALILEEGETLELEGFPDAPAGKAPVGTDSAGDWQADWPTLDECQRRYIERVLERCGGVIDGAKGAAALLGMRPSTLRSRMKKLGVSRDRGRR